MKRKAKRTLPPNGCPLCGAMLRKVSGLMRCDKCSHTVGLFRESWHAPDRRPRAGGVIGGPHILPTNSDRVLNPQYLRTPSGPRSTPLNLKVEK